MSGVRVVAVESALRDLDDLAGNAARVASAAGELDESIAVFVEIPYAPGWERAVEEVEAAGLLGKIRTGSPDNSGTPPYAQLAEQLSVWSRPTCRSRRPPVCTTRSRRRGPIRTGRFSTAS